MNLVFSRPSRRWYRYTGKLVWRFELAEIAKIKNGSFQRIFD